MAIPICTYNAAQQTSIACYGEGTESRGVCWQRSECHSPEAGAECSNNVRVGIDGKGEPVVERRTVGNELLGGQKPLLLLGGAPGHD